MMKKTLFTVMLTVLGLGLTGCGDGESTPHEVCTSFATAFQCDLSKMNLELPADQSDALVSGCAEVFESSSCTPEDLRLMQEGVACYMISEGLCLANDAELEECWESTPAISDDCSDGLNAAVRETGEDLDESSSAETATE